MILRPIAGRPLAVRARRFLRRALLRMSAELELLLGRQLCTRGAFKARERERRRAWRDRRSLQPLARHVGRDLARLFRVVP